MRWGWRLSYYLYSVSATDEYPPFTLADVPSYPARLDVRYPEKLSRGLVLVKWWLLAGSQTRLDRSTRRNPGLRAGSGSTPFIESRVRLNAARPTIEA